MTRLTRLPRVTRAAQDRRRRLTRSQFISKILAVPGSANVALLWMPRIGDTTTSTSSDTNARTITWDADVSGRITASGSLALQTFASASTQYGSTPDTTSLSFGNGTVDAAFSIVVLANVTDTAAARTLVSKWHNANLTREYAFQINATDNLSMLLCDTSASANTLRVSDAAITQGGAKLLAMTYDGSGGATAGNGITLYQDAAVVASTATNNASYVALENTASNPRIGGLEEGAQYFDGSLGMALVCLGALSATQLGQIKAHVNSAFGLAL